MVYVRLRDDAANYSNPRRGVRATHDKPEVDVDEDDAEYLVEELGDFEYVDDPVAAEAADEDADVSSADAEAEAVELTAEDDPAEDDAGDEDEADDEVEEEPEPGTPEAVVDPPFDPTELTVAELEDELESGDYSEAELLAIYSAEREADDRTTAVEAIDAALEG